MSEAFLVRRGGMGKAFAAISVTYPAGSVCTCTNGSRTFRAKDTSGSFLFPIPESGTWTVKSANGTTEVEKSVTISGYGQYASVTLAYRTYLFDGNSGGDITSVTGGWQRKSVYAPNYSEQGAAPGGTTTSSRIQITMQADWYSGVVHTKKPIRIDGKSTLHAVCNIVKSAEWLGIAIWDRVPSSNYNTGLVAEAQIRSTTPSISLSGLSSGDYYIGFFIFSNENSAELQVTEVYMD